MSEAVRDAACNLLTYSQSLAGVTSDTWMDHPPQGPFYTNEEINVGAYTTPGDDTTEWIPNPDSVCNLPTTDPKYCDCSSILIECADGGGLYGWYVCPALLSAALASLTPWLAGRRTTTSSLETK